MYLKEVHMENFKSFGRKLTVPFEPGFTGITGPNGSGKSNIGDAILFVLAPNSPRHIRAGRLTDLIFNGGSSGKAANYTIVSLTFDNAGREMPLDEDDVILTRKVKRAPKKGDPTAYNSYFYVNGRAAKKREFVDLLNHARISADGYNITKQGDVLALCDMTDGKRREILDGIAGVTTFDNDIAKANKRQDQVEENLERIAIVLEEIERNLKQLDKEKDAAQKYKQLQEDIGRIKGLKAWRRAKDLETQIANVQQQIDEFQEKRVKHEEQRAALTDKLDEAEKVFIEIEQEIRKRGGAEVEEIQEKVREARDQMVRMEEKALFIKEELSGGEEDLEPLKRDLRKIEQELANTRKIASTAEQEHADAAAKLAERNSSLESARKMISQQNEGAMSINRELGKLKKEHEDKRIELHDARLRFDRLGEKVEAARRAAREAADTLESATTDKAELDIELADLSQTAGGSGKKRKELERRVFELRKAEADLTAEAEQLDNRIRRLTRELAELNAQEAAAARHSGGAGRAVTELLKARDDGSIKGIVGTISELASAEDRFQTALQTAAGANMNAIVVEDDGVAQQCIELIKRTKAGRAKLLPLNKMVPGRPRGQALMKVKKDGCMGFALDLIDFNQRYHGAFWNVFGDTLVVTNMSTGRNLMGGVRMVTLEGELFEAGGAMVGGARGKKDAAAFSNNDRSRIDELASETAAAEAAHGQTIERLSNVRKERAKLDDELSDMGREGVGAEDRLKLLQRQVEDLTKRIEAAKTAAEEKAKEADEAEAERADLKDHIEALEKRLAEMESIREEKAQLLLKGTKKELRDQVESLEAEVRELNNTVLQAQNRQEIATKQAELVLARKQEQEAAIERMDGGRGKLEEDLGRYLKSRDKAKAEVEALMKMERKATKQLGGLRDKKDAAYQKITDLKAQRDKVLDRLETMNSLVINAKSKLPSLEETYGEAKVEMAEHPVEIAVDERVPAFDDLRRQQRNLESRLDNLGPVNMRALEEFEAQSERKSELDSEVERLKSQREELITLVEEISERKKGVFMLVFDAINENFTDVYKDLSLGGKAYMELENKDDPFAGGLILKAQPMGKRVTRLQALSGGEKSLTSMAFIFAIQRYDPSPFYYFDEVDQNLDAVNSELLAKMIKKNAQFAQFIQVSLRKITLKEANFLYGVTQQVPGQSDIIADFDLNEFQEPEAETDGTNGVNGAEGSNGKTPDAGADEPDKGLSDSIKEMVEVHAAP